MVRNLDAEFETAVTKLLELEGGYSLNPADPGGETNFGISKREYPAVDVKNLTADGAKAIYKRDYWQPLLRYNLDQRFLAVAFSASVNQGLTKVARWIDDSKGQLHWFMAARQMAYVADKNWTTFGLGWTRRLMQELI